MSKIEWTQKTWNPIVGCSIKSPGCINCYAQKDAYRFGFNPNLPRYHGLTKLVNGKAVWTGELREAPEATLLAPLKRKAPTTYFVNSMSDLFHEDVPDDWIDKVFAVMALTPQHTYQVLTKRSARMREYMSHPERKRMMAAQSMPISCALAATGGHQARIKLDHFSACFAGSGPFPNVWLGVSTERQQEADERIPDLLATPAAIRFISAEPLLGPMSLRWAAWDNWKDADGNRRPRVNELDGARMLDWVIVGGESGPDARPMHPDWARALRNQCTAAGVPFFFKQWGAWYPTIDRDKDDPDWRANYARATHQPDKFRILNFAGGIGFHGERVHLMQRYGKSASGRVLDGLIHDEYPEAAR